jgi:predicted ArsR family transcriptional regulator
MNSKMYKTPILLYLKKHGQKIDWEIAAATDISIINVRNTLTNLSKLGEVSRCIVTRFSDGKPVEGMLCRIAGTIPPQAPGRKPGVPIA